MNTVEASTFFDEFKQSYVGLIFRYNQKEKITKALTSMIYTAILDGPEITELPTYADACYLHLKVNKIHILIGVNTLGAKMIKIESDFDKLVPTDGFVEAAFFDINSTLLLDATFDSIVERIELINETNLRLSEILKENKEEKLKIKNKLIEIKEQLSPDLEFKVSKNKSLSITINDISEEKLEQLKNLLKDYK